MGCDVKKPQMLLPEPIMVGAFAMFNYSFDLMSKFDRTDRYGGDYSLARTFGKGLDKKIIIPRGLVTIGEDTKDLRTDGFDVEFTSSFKPRDINQERFINSTVSYLQAGKNFISEAPTGFGKTACGSEVIARVGKKTLIIVTKSDIRDQWVEAFKQFLGLEDKDIGFIQGDTFQVANRKVVIAMVQSIAKEDRYPQAFLDEFGFVIFDEVHRVGADYFSQSCFRVKAKLRWGVSATPDRKDGKLEVIKAHIGPVLVREEAMNLIPRVIARQSPWKLPMVSRTNPKTGQKEVVPLPHSAGRCTNVAKLLAGCNERNALLAQFIAAAYKKDRCILVQSDFIDHLQVMESLIASHGVPPAHIGWYVGGMSKEALEATKKLPVCLSTFKMTSEATNNPRWDTLVMCTPRSDVVQIVGRILRTDPNKKDPVVFDVIDSSSHVYNGYWNARRRWYKAIGAAISI